MVGSFPFCCRVLKVAIQSYLTYNEHRQESTGGLNETRRAGVGAFGWARQVSARPVVAGGSDRKKFLDFFWGHGPRSGRATRGEGFVAGLRKGQFNCLAGLERVKSQFRVALTAVGAPGGRNRLDGGAPAG